MVSTIAQFVVPLLLAPFVILAIRPLFAVFVREGVELFADFNLSENVAVTLARALAVENVIVFVVTWIFVRTCILLEGPHLVTAALAVTGLFIALTVTLLEVRSRLSIVWAKAVLVALIAFAGGNLPVLVTIPVVLALL